MVLVTSVAGFMPFPVSGGQWRRARTAGMGGRGGTGGDSGCSGEVVGAVRQWSGGMVGGGWKKGKGEEWLLGRTACSR